MLVHELIPNVPGAGYVCNAKPFLSLSLSLSMCVCVCVAYAADNRLLVDFDIEEFISRIFKSCSLHVIALVCKARI
jgi:hypothetical protein